MIEHASPDTHLRARPSPFLGDRMAKPRRPVGVSRWRALARGRFGVPIASPCHQGATLIQSDVERIQR
jgi:hypothetical protein